MTSSEFDILRLLQATKHALRGFRDAFRSQVSIRQEVLIILVMTPFALWLGENGVERALMIGALLLILLTELMNAAIEMTVDRIGTEHHELSRKAKDMAAAAVLVSLVTAAICMAAHFARLTAAKSIQGREQPLRAHARGPWGEFV